MRRRRRSCTRPSPATRARSATCRSWTTADSGRNLARFIAPSGLKTVLNTQGLEFPCPAADLLARRREIFAHGLDVAAEDLAGQVAERGIELRLADQPLACVRRYPAALPVQFAYDPPHVFLQLLRRAR